MAEYSPGWCAHYHDLASHKDHARGTRLRLGRSGIFYLPRDARVLDLCCGTGETIRQLREAGFASVFGADLARDLLQREAGRLPVMVSDASRPAVRPSSLDAVVILTSLHHVKPLPRIEQCLASVYEALKPGGRLFLIDHHNGPWMRLAILFLRTPFSRLFSRTTRLRNLILNEMDDLGYWLEHWPEALSLIGSLGYKIEVLDKAPFHFYLRAVRPKDPAI